MKAPLFIAALLLTARAWAQTPPLGSNTISVTTSDAPSVALEKMKVALASQGYTVDSLSDKVLKTSPKIHEFKRYGIITPAQHVFRIVPSTTSAGTVLTISGTLRVQINNVQKFEATMGWYSNADVSQDKDAFIEAQKIAQSYPGGKIQYLKRP